LVRGSVGTPPAQTFDGELGEGCVTREAGNDVVGGQIVGLGCLGGDEI
jgi:hypothetical protein